jgi:hypothetical protein
LIYQGKYKKKMVPKAGLEPAWISPHAPQTCVSTSSTTSAQQKYYYITLKNAISSSKREIKVDFIGFFLQTMSYTGAATLKRESC